MPRLSQLVLMLSRSRIGSASDLTASQGQKLPLPPVQQGGGAPLLALTGQLQPCMEVWPSMKNCAQQQAQQNPLQGAGRQLCPFAIPAQYQFQGLLLGIFCAFDQI